MNIFTLLDDAQRLSHSFRVGNRTHVIDSILSDDYTKPESLAIVVAMAVALPTEEVDFLSDMLNSKQETDEDFRNA